MNLSELRTEFLARGFDYFNQDASGLTRATRYINAGRAELDRLFLWPWREQSVTGVAPFAVTDLGPIEAVINTSQNDQPLARVDYQTLLSQYGDLSTGGTPLGYYVGWSSGDPVVATYPTSGDTIGVQYWSVPPDLSADSDEPASPSEVHYLIVDLAVRRAYRDSDNHESAEAIQGEIDRQLDALLFQYPPGQQDGPDSRMIITGASEDW